MYKIADFRKNISKIFDEATLKPVIITRLNQRFELRYISPVLRKPKKTKPPPLIQAATLPTAPPVVTPKIIEQDELPKKYSVVVSVNGIVIRKGLSSDEADSFLQNNNPMGDLVKVEE